MAPGKNHPFQAFGKFGSLQIPTVFHFLLGTALRPLQGSTASSQWALGLQKRLRFAGTIARSSVLPYRQWNSRNYKRLECKQLARQSVSQMVGIATWVFQWTIFKYESQRAVYLCFFFFFIPATMPCGQTQGR